MLSDSPYRINPCYIPIICRGFLIFNIKKTSCGNFARIYWSKKFFTGSIYITTARQEK